jgi:hypothetical protein
LEPTASDVLTEIKAKNSIPDQDDCPLAPHMFFSRKWPTASDLQAGSYYGASHHATVDIVARNDDGSNGDGFP